MIDKLYLEWVFRPNAILLGVLPAPTRQHPHAVDTVRITLRGSRWVSIMGPTNIFPLLLLYTEFVQKVEQGKLVLTGVADENKP